MRAPPSGGGGGAAPDIHGYPQMDTARAGTRYYYAGMYGSYAAMGMFQYNANVINAVPVVFARDTTLVGLHVQVIGAAALKVIRLGIYDSINDASNLYPNNLILDAGTVSTTLVAFVSIAINQTLTGGKLYWLASVSDAAPVTQCPERYTMWPILGWDATLSGAGGGNRGGRAWYAPFVYAALPATFPTVGSAIFGNVQVPGLIYSMA